MVAPNFLCQRFHIWRPCRVSLQNPVPLNALLDSPVLSRITYSYFSTPMVPSSVIWFAPNLPSALYCALEATKGLLLHYITSPRPTMLHQLWNSLKTSQGPQCTLKCTRGLPVYPRFFQGLLVYSSATQNSPRAPWCFLTPLGDL